MSAMKAGAALTALLLVTLSQTSSRQLAREILIADTNLLTPYRLVLDPADLHERLDTGQFDIPRAKEGGLDLAFMGILVPSSTEGRGGAKRLADERVASLRQIVESAAANARLVTSSDEARLSFRERKVGIAIALENGLPIENELSNLAHFYESGVRMITIVHSRPNQIGDSSYSQDRPHGGLSPFGKDVVREMNRLGLLIDVSHIADAAFDDVLVETRAPVIASHSSCRHFTPGWERNLDDERIRRLAENGGVIHVTFGGSFLSTELSRLEQPVWDHVEGQGLSINSVEGHRKARTFRAEKGIRYARVSEVVDHIDHVVELVGVDHVGLGSGFDGSGDSMPDGLKDVTSYHSLLKELSARGYSRNDIEKISGENFLRVWSEVERTSRSLQADAARIRSQRGVNDARPEFP
jgi:membrane dipeptidase